MNVVSRGIRNAFRNSIRTFSIVVILGLSVGLALAMLVARQAVGEKIASVKSSIGNTISISPAGAQGFQGGGEPLTTIELAKIISLSHVTKLTETLSDRLTTENTNLVSAIEPGTLGRRQAGNSGVGFMAPPDGGGGAIRFGNGSGSAVEGTFTRTFTPPVIVTGTSDATQASAFSGSTPTFTSGQNIDATKDENVAVVGKALAEKNSLSVGSTFTAYSTTITVEGIYDTGTAFTNAGLVMSLPALQRLSAQTGSVTSAEVSVDSIDNIDAAVASIKSTLGDTADVTSNQDAAKAAITPLENVKTISLFSLIGALIAGAVIILLTMIMIVRERRREIGVMKAIGASNLKVMFQFMSEAVTLTLLGLIVGLAIGVAAANPVTKVLVNNSANSTSSNQGQERGFARSSGLREFGTSSLTNIRSIKTSVGPDILLYGIGAAFLIATIGSAVPAFLISKIRPAEVMRAE